MMKYGHIQGPSVKTLTRRHAHTHTHTHATHTCTNVE